MRKEEHCKLLFGPYDPPKTRPGKFLFCEMRGTVKVGGYSDGLIPWPVKWGTRWMAEFLRETKRGAVPAISESVRRPRRQVDPLSV